MNVLDKDTISFSTWCKSHFTQMNFNFSLSLYTYRCYSPLYLWSDFVLKTILLSPPLRATAPLSCSSGTPVLKILILLFIWFLFHHDCAFFFSFFLKKRKKKHISFCTGLSLEGSGMSPTPRCSHSTVLNRNRGGDRARV